MRFDVLTLFPEMFEPVKTSIIGRATQNNLIELNLIKDKFLELKPMSIDQPIY